MSLSRSPYFDKAALKRFESKLLLAGIAYGSVRFQREVRRFKADYRFNQYQLQNNKPANAPRKYRDDTMRVDIHADMVKIKAMKPAENDNVPKRGEISSFSRKSKQRLMMLLADEIRVPDIMITLTFSDDCYINWMDNFKKNLEAFRRRLERAYEGISAIWRLEIETRKSGEWSGQPMPHFHLIIWLPPAAKDTFDYRHSIDDLHLWSKWWHEITQSQDENHKYRGFHISKIRSRRHSYHYVSKYVSKSSVDNLSVGRRWGRFGTVGQGSRASEIITKREYIHLKRLIMSYLKRPQMRKNKNGKYEPFRNKNLARRYASKSPHVGMTIFGLGIWTSPEFSIDKSTIMKMIRHAKELAESDCNRL